MLYNRMSKHNEALGKKSEHFVRMENQSKE
jgi:hypothetical protein